MLKLVKNRTLNSKCTFTPESINSVITICFKSEYPIHQREYCVLINSVSIEQNSAHSSYMSGDHLYVRNKNNVKIPFNGFHATITIDFINHDRVHGKMMDTLKCYIYHSINGVPLIDNICNIITSYLTPKDTTIKYCIYQSNYGICKNYFTTYSQICYNLSYISRTCIGKIKQINVNNRNGINCIYFGFKQGHQYVPILRNKLIKLNNVPFVVKRNRNVYVIDSVNNTFNKNLKMDININLKKVNNKQNLHIYIFCERTELL